MITLQEEQELIKRLSEMSPMEYDRVMKEVDKLRRNWNVIGFNISPKNKKPV